MTNRTCTHCGGPLPAGCRRNRVYCTTHCTSAASWERDKAKRMRTHKAWRDATRVRRLALILASKPIRHCEECGATLPKGSRSSRRFCSRRCTNVRSLRDRYDQRIGNNRRRRARLRAAGGVGVSERDWRRLVNRYGERCAYCGAKEPITMDHVIPVARGERHSIGNVLPACFPCNAAKRDDFLAHWLHRIPYARLARTAA